MVFRLFTVIVKRCYCGEACSEILWKIYYGYIWCGLTVARPVFNQILIYGKWELFVYFDMVSRQAIHKVKLERAGAAHHWLGPVSLVHACLWNELIQAPRLSSTLSKDVLKLYIFTVNSFDRGSLNDADERQLQSSIANNSLSTHGNYNFDLTFWV